MGRISLGLFVAAVFVVAAMLATGAQKGPLVGGSLCLFLALAVVVAPMLAAGARKVWSEGRAYTPWLGGWKPIKDLSDPHVKDIAEFAVAEYNKQSKAGLVLKSLVSGETQVVAGMNYRLVVVAAKEAATNHYEAVVYEKPWLPYYRNLTSFKPVKA